METITDLSPTNASASQFPPPPVDVHDFNSTSRQEARLTHRLTRMSDIATAAARWPVAQG